ncbi:hypothetical protein LXL04_022063 [Taraxacum kok-saghyz]
MDFRVLNEGFVEFCKMIRLLSLKLRAEIADVPTAVAKKMTISEGSHLFGLPVRHRLLSSVSEAQLASHMMDKDMFLMNFRKLMCAESSLVRCAVVPNPVAFARFLAGLDPTAGGRLLVRIERRRNSIRRFCRLDALFVCILELRIRLFRLPERINGGITVSFRRRRKAELPEIPFLHGGKLTLELNPVRFSGELATESVTARYTHPNPPSPIIRARLKFLVADLSSENVKILMLLLLLRLGLWVKLVKETRVEDSLLTSEASREVKPELDFLSSWPLDMDGDEWVKKSKLMYDERIDIVIKTQSHSKTEKKLDFAEHALRNGIIVISFRRKKGFPSKNAISQRKLNFAEGALRNGGISQTLVAFRRACSAKLIDLLRNRVLTPVHRSDM